MANWWDWPTITTMSNLEARGYTGQVYPVFEERSFDDEIYTVGSGQWADEEVYAFENADDAAGYALRNAEMGYLTSLVEDNDQISSASLVVALTEFTGGVPSEFEPDMLIDFTYDENGLDVWVSDFAVEQHIFTPGVLAACAAAELVPEGPAQSEVNR